MDQATLNARRCDVCDETDELPRHIHDLSTPNDIGDLTQVRHIHCCAQAGCPSGTCTTATSKEK